MRRYSPTFIALMFFLVLDSMAFYAAYVNRNKEYNPIDLHDAAPAVKWTAFDGSAHTLKELTGHVVVLHFWGAWCPPCREEFPKLLKAAAADPNVIFLTVSSDDSKEKASQFIQMAPALSGIQSPSNVLYAWDPAKTITYDQFLTARFPETIFIDPTGIMRRKFPTPVDWDSKEIHDFITALKGIK